MSRTHGFPARIARALAPNLIPLTLLLVLASSQVAAAADDAGASTLAGARKRYARKQFQPGDIRVPKTETPAPQNLPSVPDAGPGDAGLRFSLETFEVNGNSLLLPSDIDTTLAPFLKPDASIADIEKARDALQKAYEEAGFLAVVVTLPQQTVSAGTVRIDVAENRIGRVTVENEGVRWFSDDLVLRDTPHLVSGATLRREDLDADLATARRNPDRDVQARLSAGQDPGTADLTLVVDDRIPLHGSVTYNNRYTAGSPPTRAITNLSYTNLWGIEHAASVSYQFSPDSRFDQVQIYAGTYQAPMPWNSEQSLLGYVVRSGTSNSVTAAPGLGVTGKGLIAGLRFFSPLPDYGVFEGFSHRMSFGADRKDIENALIPTDVDPIVTPITYIPFTAEYNATLVTEQTYWNTRLGLSFNFAGMTPGGSTADFQMNRGGVSPNNPVTGTYQIFSGSLDWAIRLPGVLQTLAAGRFIELPPPGRKSFAEDWTFNLVMRGQAASQPLISTEQFAAGGVDTVRGYLESEAFGDDAFNIQAEFRSPYFRNFLGGHLHEAAQLVAFYDGAQLYTLPTTTGPVPSQDLQGVGVGVRAYFFENVQAQFFIAHPRTPTFDTGNSMWRYHFQVSAGF